MSRQWLEKMERIGVDITSGYMGVGDGGGGGVEQEESEVWVPALATWGGGGTLHCW